MTKNREVPVARHEFVSLDGQRYACIRDVDGLEPFLMSIVGDSDVWLFAGSNSPFTAGRVDPDHAMFPYQTADKLLRHSDASGASIAIDWATGAAEQVAGAELSAAASEALFARNGSITRLTVRVPREAFQRDRPD